MDEEREFHAEDMARKARSKAISVMRMDEARRRSMPSSKMDLRQALNQIEHSLLVNPTLAFDSKAPVQQLVTSIPQNDHAENYLKKYKEERMRVLEARAEEAARQIAIENAKRKEVKAPEPQAKVSATTIDAKSSSEKTVLPTSPSKATNSQTANSLVENAIARRKEHASRKPQVESMCSMPQYKRTMNHVKQHLNSLTEKVGDLQYRIDGVLPNGTSPQGQGPRKLMNTVEKSAPQYLALVMHAIADRIVEVAASKTSPESLKYGDSSFALAYLTLALCIARPDFTNFIRASLEAACPYIVPGLRSAVETELAQNQGDPNFESLRKAALGYHAEELDSNYLSRMQAIVAFYGACLQTNTARLASAPLVLIPAPCRHPFELLSDNHIAVAEAWRFIAGHLNSRIWRWTLYILQAFIAVTGHELAKAYRVQFSKIIVLMRSKEAMDELTRTGKNPDDTDRRILYERQMEGLFMTIVQKSHVPHPPGINNQDSRDLVVNLVENEARVAE